MHFLMHIYSLVLTSFHGQAFADSSFIRGMAKIYENANTNAESLV